jgi:hypothetical protein
MWLGRPALLADPISEANRIMEAADSKKITLKLFGGVSFFLRCPSAKHRSLQRNYVDIDFVGYSKQLKEIKQFFPQLGYAARDRFNAMMGHRRLVFNDVENGRRVDVFLDVFEMCHKLNLKDRIRIDSRTIPLADMLATKLQIVEINEKDIKDILSILIDYDVTDTDQGAINGAYLAKLCGDDWGIYKTFTMNLDRILTTLSERELEQGEKDLVKARIEHLKQAIESVPKSLRWRFRAQVGERAVWYELPEADKEVVDSRLPEAK